jgi:hypothetical protein
MWIFSFKEHRRGLTEATPDTSLDADGGISFPMREALLNGVFSHDMITENTPTCPTGNCTWPTFNSLAICSKCVDVTAYSVEHSKCHYTAAKRLEPLPDYWNRNCTFHLPSLPQGYYTMSEDDSGDLYNSMVLQTFDYNLSTAAGNSILKKPLFAFGKLRFATETGAVADPRALIKDAHECAIAFCIKTYNISVRNGIVQPDVLSIAYGELDRDGNVLITAAIPRAEIADSNFSISEDTGVRISTSFNNYFIRNVSANTFYGSESRVTSTTDVLSAFNQCDYFPILMNSVAASLTNQILNASSLVVYGEAGATETFVHIKWVWLVLPATVIVSSLLFLALAMFETRRQQIQLWKHSSLALLFHGLDGPVEDVAMLNDMDQMEKKAKKMRVRLGRTERDGWKLLRVGRGVC